jgi:hypothetical protein
MDNSQTLTAFRVRSSLEIIEAIPTIWDDITFEESQSVLSEWIQRGTWVIEHGGNITVNECSSLLKEFSLAEKNRAVRTFWTPYIFKTFHVDR